MCINGLSVLVSNVIISQYTRCQNVNGKRVARRYVITIKAIVATLNISFQI